MASIIKTYTEDAPASRFIGIQYGEQDRVEGSFSHLWAAWFKAGRFAPLEALVNQEWAGTFPEAGSYIGLMRMKDLDDFEYWIGLFTPPGTPVPEGYAALDFPALAQGVCWVQGMENEIYHQEEACLTRLAEDGVLPFLDEEGYEVVMERYQAPRFTQAGAAGERVLDIVVISRVSPELEGESFEELDPSGLFYCANCRKAGQEQVCGECGSKGTELDGNDPIFIGDLPGRLRNALQIAFGATEIPFNALASLGSGFTLSAGDLFESYKIYVPYTRSREALTAFERVFEINKEPYQP